MKRLSTIFVFGLLAMSLAAVGCRMCDPCYPLGGLLGRENQENGCDNCELVPRVGSIVGTPQETATSNSPVDPSTLATDQDEAEVADPAEGS